MSAIHLAERQEAEADIVLADEEVRDKDGVDEDEDGVVDEAAEDDLDPAGTYRISSYGAAYAVDTLVSRLKKGTFFVPPFQRAYVWSQRQASRFIESLLLGLPVPGVFVAKEPGTAKHLIVDGQQRLKTLQYFFEGYFQEPQGRRFKLQGRRFRLQGVDERWCGKTIDELGWYDKQRLGDSIIHITIFQQEKPDDDSSVYLVFERLNTGGSKLYPQEIRSCVSRGKFIDLLQDINRDATWRKLFGRESDRQKDQELILRFLAFFYERGKYERPMRGFLNGFTRRYRNLDDQSGSQFRKVFLDTVGVAYDALGGRAFRPKNNLNTAVFDAVMVGLAKRLDRGPLTDSAGLQSAYDSLLDNRSFHDAYSKGTAGVESVRARFDLAEGAFQKLK